MRRKTPNQSEPEALLLRHQDSEKVVYYDTSVWLLTEWGSFILEAADGQTGVLEPGAHFTDRGFPERRTCLHAESGAGGHIPVGDEGRGGDHLTSLNCRRFCSPGPISPAEASQSGRLVCMESPEQVYETRQPDEQSFQAEIRPSVCCAWPDWLVDEYMMYNWMQKQQVLLQYLHLAYTP
ncbi:unnamed protein product [Protopolystoma xenopodis]|uniref:Uncharacterized protein n=1 Tax=Protopolystoma xenopodis TaxID=117903 RepID=A0A3S5CH83_9PLAT|nr:unnamed protein product [Protopolystoma xenopodis]